MQSQLPEQQNEPETPASPQKTGPITNPDFSSAPQPIRELAGREDFPQCALGVHVDIQGFTGVVVDIVKESIRVRPVDGMTQRFNANRLRTLYAPPPPFEPMPTTVAERPKPASTRKPEPASTPAPEVPPRVYVENPDFTAPVLPVGAYASQPDFPKNVYGKHVDVNGYTGVVIEIVKGSLKIQSPAGITRSYNAEIVRKMHGQGGA